MKVIAEKQIEQRPPEEPYQKLRINVEDFGKLNRPCPICEDIWCGHRIILAAKDAEIEKLKSTDWASLTETMADQIAEKDREIAELKAGLAAMAETVSQSHKDAERYRKLKPHIEEITGVHYPPKENRMSVMRKWWINLATEEDDSRSFDEIIDALPEVQS